MSVSAKISLFKVNVSTALLTPLRVLFFGKRATWTAERTSVSSCLCWTAVVAKRRWKSLNGLCLRQLPFAWLLIRPFNSKTPAAYFTDCPYISVLMMLSSWSNKSELPSSQLDTSSGTPPEVRTPTWKLRGTSVTLSSKSKMATLWINSEKAEHSTVYKLIRLVFMLLHQLNWQFCSTSLCRHVDILCANYHIVCCFRLVLANSANNNNS